jgi:transcriptional regulator with XRE-family HTH domain
MVKPMQVTNSIRALRLAADEMTQAEWADRVGVTRQTIIAIEQGRSDQLSLTEEDLLRPMRGCDAVISCLVRSISLRGIFGAPRDLVTCAAAQVCAAVRDLRPSAPVRLILMSSVSVNVPRGLDARRGWFENAVLWLLRGLVPPSRDNQWTADFLWSDIGTADPFVEWVAVLPDTLVDGDVSEHALHEHLVSSLFAPDKTGRTNVAHFICELVTEPQTWDEGKHRLPVIINAGAGVHAEQSA